MGHEALRLPLPCGLHDQLQQLPGKVGKAGMWACGRHCGQPTALCVRTSVCNAQAKEIASLASFFCSAPCCAAGVQVSILLSNVPPWAPKAVKLASNTCSGCKAVHFEVHNWNSIQRLLRARLVQRPCHGGRTKKQQPVHCACKLSLLLCNSEPCHRSTPDTPS